MTEIQLAKDDEDKDGEVSMKFEVKSDSPAQPENKSDDPEVNKTPESDNDEDKNGEVSMKFEVKSDSPAKTEDETQGINDDKPSGEESMDLSLIHI